MMDADEAVACRDKGDALVLMYEKSLMENPALRDSWIQEAQMYYLAYIAWTSHR